MPTFERTRCAFPHSALFAWNDEILEILPILPILLDLSRSTQICADPVDPADLGRSGLDPGETWRSWTRPGATWLRPGPDLGGTPLGSIPGSEPGPGFRPWILPDGGPPQDPSATLAQNLPILRILDIFENLQIPRSAVRRGSGARGGPP